MQHEGSQHAAQSQCGCGRVFLELLQTSCILSSVRIALLSDSDGSLQPTEQLHMSRVYTVYTAAQIYSVCPLTLFP